MDSKPPSIAPLSSAPLSIAKIRFIIGQSWRGWPAVRLPDHLGLLLALAEECLEHRLRLAELSRKYPVVTEETNANG